MKIEITKGSFNRITEAKWFKITLKVLVGIFALYLLVGLGLGIAIFGFHKENNLPKAVYTFYSYPAAWVNFEPITVNEVLKQASFIKNYSKATGQELPSDADLSDEVMTQLIDTKLLWQQANKYGIKISSKEVDDTFNEMAEKNNGKDEVIKILKEMYGMNEKDFKNLIKDQLMMEKLQSDLFVQIKAQHILIKDEARAKEVLEKIKKGEKNFDDAAKEYSEDTASKDTAGDLGWFGRGMMVPEFETAAFAIEPGNYGQDLVKTSFGYHIIKVNEKKGKIDKSYTDWFNEIKSKAKIYIWYNEPIKQWFKNQAKVETASLTPTITQ